MIKKIIGIIILMLVISTAFPVVIPEKNSEIKATNPNHPLISMAGNWTETQKLLASDHADFDSFGCSVSINGDYVIVGALYDDSYRGSAYVFKRSGTSWVEEAKLVASNGAAYDLFGESVSLSGDYALIGAPGNDSFRGSAYVFKRSGTSWVEEAKLVASDGATDDVFGVSVSIDGDYAFIGVYHDDDLGNDSGSAYVFKRSGTSWVEEAKLVASDGATDDRFGDSVFIDGDYAVIGASGDDSGRGSAYVFKRSGSSWMEEAKLVASDGATYDYFGCSVSLSGEYALIGAHDDYPDPGSAYVFKRSGTTWMQEAKLLASDGTSKNYFGGSVSLSDEYAFIGAIGDDYPGRGSVYVFKCSGSSWMEEAKLVASDGAAYDYFGCSVSLSGEYALIGACGDDSDRGSAYVFKQNLPPNKPNIDGLNRGKPGIKYEYCIIASDPDNDTLFVIWNWGDGTSSEWLGPLESGMEVSDSHSWNKTGTYNISVAVRDEYGESVTAYKEVTIPRFREVYHPFLLWFLERFPNIFSILRHIIR